MGLQRQQRYFEDFDLGDRVESPARTVTESDVMQFAGLSGDYNAIHTDAEYARQTPYGQRIAHGLLGLSIASGLAVQSGLIDHTILAFTGLQWSFRAPVFLGDTIRLRAQVIKTRLMRSMGGGLVVFAVSVANQRDEVVQQGEWTMLVRSRSLEPGAAAPPPAQP